jgi:hypothetical protein
MRLLRAGQRSARRLNCGVRRHMTRQRIVFCTVLVWFVVALISLGLRAWVVLNGPPSGDLYANTLSFQIFASMYLLVVFWFPILGGVLILEFLGFLIVDWLRFRRASRNDVPAA